MSKTPNTNQNISVREIHFNMLSNLRSGLFNYYKNSVSRAKGKFNTKYDEFVERFNMRR